MSAAVARAAECEYHSDHGRIDERLNQLEGREDKQDGKLEALERTAAGIREELAGMRGELRGALWASKMSGSVVGALVGSGVALLAAWLKRNG